MKVLFIVQGEGRGHMTQALAMEQILTSAGHQIVGVIIGTCDRRDIPDYFKAKSNAILHKVSSPNFYFDKKNRSIKLWKTIFRNALSTGRFVSELMQIDRIVNEEEPDVIINFYDILGGIYFKWYNPPVKKISIGHQYLAKHPEFSFAKKRPIQKLLFRFTNRLTSLNSDSILALSFKDLTSNVKRLNVVPPLLRKEVFDLRPENGDYILAYVVNKGYAEDLMKWHQRNKRIKIHCFWDNQKEPDGWSPWNNLTFHHINDQKFLNCMSGCMGYVSTAGFESICEAMYLNKPVMMVPVEKQYEQACNALDAEKAGAGIASSSFDLGPLLGCLSKLNEGNAQFRDWIGLCPTIIIKEVEDYVPIKRQKTISINIPHLATNK